MWQTKHSVLASGFGAPARWIGDVRLLRAPWQASHPRPACLPAFFTVAMSSWQSRQAVAPGEGDLARAVLVERARAIVPVDAESLRHEDGPGDEEDDQEREERSGEAKQVFGVSKSGRA